MIPSAYAVGLETIYTPGGQMGGSGATISKLVVPLLANTLILGGLLTFFVILFAGFNFITGAGDKAKVAQAQNTLTYAIMGLVLIVSAYVITLFVSSLLGFTALKDVLR